jgi:hypothetical protein
MVIDSEIPADHPAKREIEQGLRTALIGLPGKWRITVVCSSTSHWWMIRLDGPRVEWMTVLADPMEQDAPVVTGRVLAALRASKVMS